MIGFEVTRKFYHFTFSSFKSITLPTPTLFRSSLICIIRNFLFIKLHLFHKWLFHHLFINIHLVSTSIFFMWDHHRLLHARWLSIKAFIISNWLLHIRWFFTCLFTVNGWLIHKLFLIFILWHLHQLIWCFFLNLHDRFIQILFAIYLFWIGRTVIFKLVNSIIIHILNIDTILNS